MLTHAVRSQEIMNTIVWTAAAIAFVAGFWVSMWPRACSHKFQRILEERGEDPDESKSFWKMRELAPSLFWQSLVGSFLFVVLSTPIFILVLMRLFSQIWSETP
jgi:hypothetical protein